MRALVCLGDKTTYGEVISATATWFEGNKAIAQTGDLARCGKCQGAFPILGTAYDWSERQPYVATGDKVLCKCPDHVVYGSATQYTTTAGGALPASAPPRPAPPPASAVRPAAAQPARNNLLEEEEEEEELTEPGIVLRVGLFFDGTGNNQANSEVAAACYPLAAGLTEGMAEDVRQRCATLGYDGNGNTPDNSYGNDVSNVVRLHDLYPDDSLVALPRNADQAHIKVYLEGIGTTSSKADSLYGQGTGGGATGVLARVRQAPGFILPQIQLLQDNNPHIKIRRIEVDLFGFSRGAAAARHCANDLLKGADSLLARALPADSSVLSDAFAWRTGADIALNFIGLFDTVAGVLNPLTGEFDPHSTRNLGLDLRLAPGCARQVAQLVAANEYRHNFSLTRTEHDLLLPGAHSDIGGGYLPLAIERVLLSRPENSQVSRTTANEATDAYRRTRQRLEGEHEFWQPFAQRLGIDCWAVELRHERGAPPEKRVYAAIASERRVRGELSRVYLRIMRELAVRAGVMFDPIDPSDNRMALPAELQPIAAKLQAYALGEDFPGLSEAELALLCRDYIHLSANWNAAKGKHNSDLATLFINRPADGFKRLGRPNE